MRIIFFLTFLFSVSLCCGQKLAKIDKTCPPNTVRVTQTMNFTNKKTALFGISNDNYELTGRVLETDSSKKLLFLSACTYAIKIERSKGDSVEVVFTDDSKMQLYLQSDAFINYRWDGQSNSGFTNMYFDLNRDLQRIFRSKEVKSIFLGGLEYKFDKKKTDLIEKALELFD